MDLVSFLSPHGAPDMAASCIWLCLIFGHSLSYGTSFFSHSVTKISDRKQLK